MITLYNIWKKIVFILKIGIPLFIIFSYTYYFVMFYIHPEVLEWIVGFLWFDWLYPKFLSIPLVLWLYFYLYALSYILNICINKFFYHSPDPITGIELPKKFHTLAVVTLNLLIFFFCTLCLYVMSSLSGCWPVFIAGETPVGICSLINFTSSLSITLIPLFIIIPPYFWSIQYLIRKFLFRYHWVSDKREFLDLKGDYKDE